MQPITSRLSSMLHCCSVGDGAHGAERVIVDYAQRVSVASYVVAEF